MSNYKEVIEHIGNLNLEIQNKRQAISELEESIKKNRNDLTEYLKIHFIESGIINGKQWNFYESGIISTEISNEYAAILTKEIFDRYMFERKLVLYIPDSEISVYLDNFKRVYFEISLDEFDVNELTNIYKQIIVRFEGKIKADDKIKLFLNKKAEEYKELLFFTKNLWL